MLIPVPVIAAFVFRPAVIGPLTVLTIVLEALLSAIPGHTFEHHHVAAYVATALVGIVGASLSANRRRQERTIVHANSVAEALVRTLLRPVPHQVGPMQTAGLYRAADAAAMVGGDLYEVLETPSGGRAIIGDVRGKGLGAVRTVADVLGSFRAAALDAGLLTRLASRLEQVVLRAAEEAHDEELFVTVTLAEFHWSSSEVALVNYGHLDPVLITGGQVRTLPTASGLPMGLGALDAGQGPAVTTYRLHPGDVLLLYTDGVVEARDETGEFYPLVERLRARFAGAHDRAPSEVVDFLNTDLPRFAPRLLDDIAILAIAPGATA